MGASTQEKVSWESVIVLIPQLSFVVVLISDESILTPPLESKCTFTLLPNTFGGNVSNTVTVEEQVSEFPAASVTYK